MKPLLLTQPTINVDEETGEVLTLSKTLLSTNYTKIKSEKNIENGKITWTTSWRKSNNSYTEQGKLF